MTTAAELRALLNAVDESVQEAQRSPERVSHRTKGSIIDPIADGAELSRKAMEAFTHSLAGGAN